MSLTTCWRREEVNQAHHHGHRGSEGAVNEGVAATTCFGTSLSAI